MPTGGVQSLAPSVCPGVTARWDWSQVPNRVVPDDRDRISLLVQESWRDVIGKQPLREGGVVDPFPVTGEGPPMAESGDTILNTE